MHWSQRRWTIGITGALLGALLLGDIGSHTHKWESGVLAGLLLGPIVAIGTATGRIHRSIFGAILLGLIFCALGQHANRNGALWLVPGVVLGAFLGRVGWALLVACFVATAVTIAATILVQAYGLNYVLPLACAIWVGLVVGMVLECASRYYTPPLACAVSLGLVVSVLLERVSRLHETRIAWAVCLGLLVSTLVERVSRRAETYSTSLRQQANGSSADEPNPLAASGETGEMDGADEMHGSDQMHDPHAMHGSDGLGRSDRLD
jgi:hypothetical protein